MTDNQPRPVTRKRDAIEYLVTEQQRDPYGIIPVTRYGYTVVECAYVAWRYCFLLNRITNEIPTTADLDMAYDMVVNDDDHIAQVINAHGYGHYNRSTTP